jgi:hypothetical protein
LRTGSTAVHLFRELRSAVSVERGGKWKHQPFPCGLEENISCNNYWTAFFRFFGNDSSGATSTISDQSRRAGRWALGHYQHKRENKMKHRCKELGELFNKAQSFGCRVEDRGKNGVIFPPDRTRSTLHCTQERARSSRTVEPSATCSRTLQHRRDSNDILKWARFEV